MSRFNAISLRSPLTAHQASSVRQAREAKSKVLETVQLFQKLDGRNGVDHSPEQDVVSVLSLNPATLPSKGLAKLGFGPSTKTHGHVIANEKAPQRAEVTTNKQGVESRFSYEKLPNGNEVYQGPTSDGYATVVENSATGTLFIELSDEPQKSLFREARETIF